MGASFLGCPGPGSSPRAGALRLLCCSQHEEKEKAFREQLAHLASLLPTLQVGPVPGRDVRRLPTPRLWETAFPEAGQGPRGGGSSDTPTHRSTW